MDLESDIVIGFGESDVPVATVRVQAEYPQIAISRNAEGYVLLTFDVTRTGATDSIEVVESEPGSIFDRAAIRALERWKYLPKTVDGETMRVSNMLTKIVFEMAD